MNLIVINIMKYILQADDDLSRISSSLISWKELISQLEFGESLLSASLFHLVGRVMFQLISQL